MEQLVGFINHFMNLLLPAFWLASLMVLVHRLLFRRQAIAMRWQRQWLWLFASGAAVLLAGLLLQQRDGKMLTYTALALVVGAMQTWLLRRGHAKSK
ncbi:MAG: hypothetical protein KBD96_00770 [Brachymonas sp.]|jgi:hypothetical protein|nr:hypothetical protein [Brachymonas sp.]MBP6138781.1 hypothetical protein [Brachymonas sp.]MBP6966013.1 hypothetical protein [Brachymonas sp.]MBP7739991.1 hypothetical protein [Brachymonas sp.]MBP8596568.1 hypothetical protein [Brachymonas sp.]